MRRTTSTWVYQPGPVNFDSRYRSQHSAERAGLVTVGRFIFDSSKHAMRIIRSYNGNVPGAAVYAWVAFDAPTLNLEDWAFRDEHIQVQARKLAMFPTGEIITQHSQRWREVFQLDQARVHKDGTGSVSPVTTLRQWGEADGLHAFTHATKRPNPPYTDSL